MRHYNNILYVSHGVSNEQSGLKQALSLARNNDSSLNILVFLPEFPDNLPDYKNDFEKSIREKTEQAIVAAASDLSDDSSVEVSIDLEVNETPAVTVIQHVLENGYDLVIKEAELRDTKGGFKAFDMDLLRKCPVPVWLSRPITKHREKINVAVAIDPEVAEKSAEKMNIRLLQMSDSLAETCSQNIHIISCWDYELESVLRDNAFVRIPDEDVDEVVKETEDNHHKALIDVIYGADLECKHDVYHMRGRAADVIPELVQNHDIDILVMGTVARTGIAGFMIGNTAENVIQQLSCSLLALKPYGFVSPVKL